MEAVSENPYFTNTGASEPTSPLDTQYLQRCRCRVPYHMRYVYAKRWHHHQRLVLQYGAQQRMLVVLAPTHSAGYCVGIGEVGNFEEVLIKNFTFLRFI